MTNKTTKRSAFHFTADKELLDAATIIFDKWGLNMTTAIRMFLKQCVTLQRLPMDEELKRIGLQSRVNERDLIE